MNNNINDTAHKAGDRQRAFDAALTAKPHGVYSQAGATHPVGKSARMASLAKVFLAAAVITLTFPLLAVIELLPESITARVIWLCVGLPLSLAAVAAVTWRVWL